MKVTQLQELPLEVAWNKKKSYHKVTKMGNITEVQYISRRNTKANIQKLSKDEYVKLSDGTVNSFKHGSSRADGNNSLRKTFHKMRGLINTNCSDVSKVRWITLTYAENMTDTKRLYEDFHSFHKRFKRFCKSSGWTSPEYIAMMEPQARGAWHVHLLYIWESTAPYIENSDLARIWGHGFVTVKKLDSVDNVGAYLTAYMTDMVISEEEYRKGKISKAVRKGARLKLYPVGFQMIRHSRGIKQPESEVVRYYEAEEAVKGMSETYRKTSMIETDDGFCMFIETVYYNSMRADQTGPEKKVINQLC